MLTELINTSSTFLQSRRTSRSGWSSAFKADLSELKAPLELLPRLKVLHLHLHISDDIPGPIGGPWTLTHFACMTPHVPPTLITHFGLSPEFLRALHINWYHSQKFDVIAGLFPLLECLSLVPMEDESCPCLLSRGSSVIQSCEYLRSISAIPNLRELEVLLDAQSSVVQSNLVSELRLACNSLRKVFVKQVGFDTKYEWDDAFQEVRKMQNVSHDAFTEWKNK
jgi:hypothetical protein